MNPAELTPLTARQRRPVQGRVRVPGDKSISHRALILGALTVGETTIGGLLEGEDVLHTADAMRALGARVERDRRGHLARSWRRRRRLCRSPAARSILAIPAPAAGWRLARSRAARSRRPSMATLLCAARPMQRVLDPLEHMGARASAGRRRGRLPLTLQGAPIRSRSSMSRRCRRRNSNRRCCWPGSRRRAKPL